MPIYLFWGEDDLAIAKAVDRLKQKVLDPNWFQFNYDKLSGERADTIIQALDLAMTPVFGMGERLVWLADTTIAQHCSEELLAQLERTLPQVLETSHLLLTANKQPDKRLKVTKLIEKYAKIQQFALFSVFNKKQLSEQVEEFAKEIGVKLTPAAIESIAESVGNDTRQLWNELEKLSIYGKSFDRPLDEAEVSTLVISNTQTSFDLATAIRSGDRSRALGLLVDLINLNEPPLRIVSILVGQFRTWAIVKLTLERGEKNEKAIASAAEIGNPQRVYYLRQEVRALSSQQLLATLPILLELEVSLKRGANSLAALETKIIELCQILK
jgi:DNA polymerase-3 subunit delta